MSLSTKRSSRKPEISRARRADSLAGVLQLRDRGAVSLLCRVSFQGAAYGLDAHGTLRRMIRMTDVGMWMEDRGPRPFDPSEGEHARSEALMAMELMIALPLGSVGGDCAVTIGKAYAQGWWRHA